uniref:Insulin-like domain-containing protein n=1 Tax=Glossina brevipalpis TaxID=37001 RepID=A0A1A9W9A8_9MUSC
MTGYRQGLVMISKVFIITSITINNIIASMRCSAFVVFVVYLLLLVFIPAPIQPLPLTPSADNTSFEYKRYCSSALSDAIRLICGGRFNSLSRKYPDNIGNGMFRLKRFATDDGIFYRPKQTGLIHECCRRPCGYSELKMYCAPI